MAGPSTALLLLASVSFVCALRQVQDIVNTITGSQQTWWKALLFEYLATQCIEYHSCDVVVLSGCLSAERSAPEAFWNIVDWLSLACAWAVLGTYIRAGMEVPWLQSTSVA